MDPVIAAMRKELEEKADPAIRESSKRFFKEEISCYGLKTADVTAIAKRYWKEVRSREKAEIFSLCEELYRSGYLEESFIVSTWAHALSDRRTPRAEAAGAVAVATAIEADALPLASTASTQ